VCVCNVEFKVRIQNDGDGDGFTNLVSILPSPWTTSGSQYKRGQKRGQTVLILLINENQSTAIMQTAAIPHTQRTYVEEQQYFDSKTSMYMHLYFAVCDVARQVLEKEGASLGDKESIAKTMESATFPDGYTATWTTCEEVIDDKEMEQKVHIVVEYKDWYADMGIVWSGEDQMRASKFYSELADCDITIEWDGKEPGIEYVEKPHHSAETYERGHYVWDFEGGNTNPFKESWIVDAFMDTQQQSFNEYADQFGITDEKETLEDVVQTFLNVLENQDFDDEDDEFIDDKIVDSLLNCCEDIETDEHFEVEKGPQERYAQGFYITCARRGRVVCKSRLIQRQGDTWVETSGKKEPQSPSRKRKAS
jgi:hypothetical protein